MGEQTSPIRLVQAVYALQMGGSEVLAWRIARALTRSGRYACSLYGVCQGGALGDALAADGIPSRAFSRRGKVDLRLIGQLARQLRADKAQVVHTHHLGQLMYAGIAGRLVGARVVHTEHEYYTLSRRRSQRLLRILSGVADVVTSVAEPVTEFLRDQVKIPAIKLRTIPKGVDLNCYRSACPVARSTLGLREGDVVVGCVARLEPEKGHAVLLDAFRRVSSRFPRAKLLLIGEGSERARLQTLASGFGLNEAIRFLGERADVPELLASCDLVVLASVHEGLPMALLEAMASGKPVVATRVGSVPDLVQNGYTGLLVPPDDPTALAEALEVLVADGNQRQKLGEQAREHVQTRYDFDLTIARYTALYEAILMGKEP